MRDFIILSKLYGTIVNDWEAEIKIYKAEERELRFPPAKPGEQSVTSFILKYPELPYRIQKALCPTQIALLKRSITALMTELGRKCMRRSWNIWKRGKRSDLVGPVLNGLRETVKPYGKSAVPFEMNYTGS